MQYLICIVFLSTLFSSASATCTFPTDLTGIWENPGQGNLTFNETHMTGYDVDSYTDLTLECHLFADDKYVLRSSDFTLLGLSNVVNAAFCISLTKQSSNKYTYFIQTSQLADANYERVMFLQSSDVISSVNDVCNDTSTVNVPQETKLLVKFGEAVNEAVRCPNDILGTYWYYNHTTCTESYWDVCSVTSQMTFNYTMCSEKQFFSAGGVVRCLYNVEDNDDTVTYIYNEDSTVDNSATYQYSCMIVKKDSSDGLVYVTQYPRDCLSNQTSTYVVSSGHSNVLSANVTCDKVRVLTIKERTYTSMLIFQFLPRIPVFLKLV
ncbi:uncharacterized protein LOC132758005 [Ruditapes philippinarum]|uniref:uncharacterized protein LOC132758005 n=1 Tax=Ruditapes philippinarum TaxID=129788 RepID=UPI00295C2FAB|nr:uncharacterized protein LOC132758005 [Ruditapes philippinarum]